MKRLNSIIGLVLLVGLTGCTTARLATSTQSIVLPFDEVRKVTGGEVHFPRGLYRPAFYTDKGVYYKTDLNILVTGFGVSTIKRGGLFVPHVSYKDQRQGYWTDNQETGGFGAMGFGMTSPTRVFRFQSGVGPIRFQLGKNITYEIDPYTTSLMQ
jgi:hypothetical protein